MMRIEINKQQKYNSYENVCKHHQKTPSNNTSIKSLTLYNISFQIQTVTTLNALNRNLFFKSEVIILFLCRSLLITIMTITKTFGWDI